MTQDRQAPDITDASNCDGASVVERPCDGERDSDSAPAEVTGTASSASPEAVEIERMSAELAEKESLIDSLREQGRRFQADFENYRRRQQQNADDLKFVAREGIVGSLLPLLDNLERALQAMQATGDVQALSEGIRLIHKQMVDILGREGLTEIEALGATFDPVLHEAVMVCERDDVPDQSVVEILQRGYRLGSRVLRPSLVKVASCSSTETSNSSNQGGQ